MAMAEARKYMLARTKPMVTALHPSLLSPSDRLSPMTQQGSISPAMMR
jgi:hypothetical protein